MSSQQLKLDRGVIRKRLDSLARKLATKEELDEMVMLWAMSREAQKTADKASGKFDELERKLEQRQEDYEDANLKVIYTSRKTTAEKLKRFLGRKIVTKDMADGRYKFSIKKETVTKQLALDFMATFKTDIFNGYVERLHFSGEEA